MSVSKPTNASFEHGLICPQVRLPNLESHRNRNPRLRKTRSVKPEPEARLSLCLSAPSVHALALEGLDVCFAGPSDYPKLETLRHPQTVVLRYEVSCNRVRGLVVGRRTHELK